MAKGGRGFVLGRAVVTRRGRGAASKLARLFALAKTIRIEPTFDFYRAAQDTARRVFPEKVRREMEKLAQRGLK